MGRVAVFVDAGYFWVQACQSVLGRIGQRNEIVLDYDLLRTQLLSEVNHVSGSELLRVYWYDGPGAAGKGPDHAKIDELDDFKLRLGTRNHKGQQKAVDGLIIADMLSLTQTHAIDHAILFSGDADLTPGVTAAQAMGLRVVLVVLDPKAATSPYLAAESDRKLFLDRNWIRRFAKAADSPVVTQRPQTAGTLVPTPLSSSSASAAPACLPFEVLDVLAKKTYAELLDGPMASVVSGLEKAIVKLPLEVDKRLLWVGKSEAGRDLNEQEKRFLRKAFKQLLQN